MINTWAPDWLTNQIGGRWRCMTCWICSFIWWLRPHDKNNCIYIYTYIILHICIRTHICNIHTHMYIYIYVYTFENTSTSTPKIHTDHFRPCAGPFKPSSLPPTSNPTRSAICKAMRGDWWELHVKWFLWRFVFWKFDPQDPRWKPVFLYLESLYIKKRDIYTYIYTTVQRDRSKHMFLRQEGKKGN